MKAVKDLILKNKWKRREKRGGYWDCLKWWNDVLGHS
jgi:hypothetical protein